MRRTLPALLATLVLAAGCGAPAAASAAGAPLDHAPVAHAVQGGPIRMWTLADGGWVPFENGADQTVGGLQAQVWLTPFPPGRKAVIHYQLSRDRVPVPGALLNLTYDHQLMDHGPFAVSAAEEGTGRFSAPLEFIMAGRFWVDTTLRVDGGELQLKLLVESDR